MRNEKGQFVKGFSSSPLTQFKKGSHWRNHQKFREKEWLEINYTELCRSAEDIANEFNVHANAILYWLRKHGIPRRPMGEIRKLKHWGAIGSDNPMWNKKGELNPRWLGGITPERQSFYTSNE